MSYSSSEKYQSLDRQSRAPSEYDREPTYQSSSAPYQSPQASQFSEPKSYPQSNNPAPHSEVPDYSRSSNLQRLINFPPRNNNQQFSQNPNQAVNSSPVNAYQRNFQSQRQAFIKRYGVEPLPVDSVIRRYPLKHVDDVVKRNMKEFPEEDQSAYRTRSLKSFVFGMFTLNFYCLAIAYELGCRKNVWYHLTKSGRSSVLYFIPSVCLMLYFRNFNKDQSKMILKNRELVEKLLVQEDYIKSTKLQI